MCAKKGRGGRPRIYDNNAARQRAHRAREKKAGYKEVTISLPDAYKTLFDKFCDQNNMGQADGLCYLLDICSNFSDSFPVEHQTEKPNSVTRSASTHE